MFICDMNLKREYFLFRDLSFAARGACGGVSLCAQSPRNTLLTDLFHKRGPEVKVKKLVRVQTGAAGGSGAPTTSSHQISKINSQTLATYT